MSKVFEEEVLLSFFMSKEDEIIDHHHVSVCSSDFRRKEIIRFGEKSSLAHSHKILLFNLQIGVLKIRKLLRNFYSYAIKTMEVC